MSVFSLILSFCLHCKSYSNIIPDTVLFSIHREERERKLKCWKEMAMSDATEVIFHSPQRRAKVPWCRLCTLTCLKLVRSVTFAIVGYGHTVPSSSHISRHPPPSQVPGRPVPVVRVARVGIRELKGYIVSTVDRPTDPVKPRRTVCPVRFQFPVSS